MTMQMELTMVKMMANDNNDGSDGDDNDNGENDGK